MEKEVEGFYCSKTQKTTTEGNIDWHIDWLSRSSKHQITYNYEDKIYYVRNGYKNLSDVTDDFKFNDLDSAITFVKEQENNNEA